MTMNNKTRVIAEPGKQEFFITREFDAPRELVFKAFVDPKVCVQWLLGPKKMGLKMKLEKFDPKAGGAWRYTQSDENGNQYGFHGSYHDVSPQELIIDTFEFEGVPDRGHVSLETLKFEELPDERTKLSIHSVFQSVADRDETIKSGMEEGIGDSFDRLEELLAKLPRSLLEI